MSIASEITRLQNAKASIKTSLENKGATVPSSTTLDGYSTIIDNLPSGGGQLDLTTGIKFGQSTFTTLPTTIINANWGDVTDFNKTFLSCTDLKTLPLIDTSSGTDFGEMFRNSTKLETIALIDTSNGTNFGGMFQDCTNLQEIPQLNTSNGIFFNAMFASCTQALKTIPELDFSKATNIASMFVSSKKIENLGGFKDLGKAYLTTASANYSNYKLDLSPCKLLTHDSLMNVINKLYDIKTKGCNQQQLVLGSTNLAKLTSAEIQIATDKGWAVS